MSTRTLLSALALVLGITLPSSPAEAQQAGLSFAPDPPALSAAPALAAASVALRTPEALPAATPALLQRRASRRSTTLMIVGGAIFLAGAIIGDDAGAIIMIGGAATALYGLYLYLEQDSAAPLPLLPAQAAP